MRTLIFLFLGVLVFVAVVVSNRLDSRDAGGEGGSVPDDDTTLGARLTEAAAVFSSAAALLSEDRSMLKAALSELARQCEALAIREEGTGALSRRSRVASGRLLLALYGAVERVTTLAQHTTSPETDVLLDSSVGLIVEATDALHSIGEKADESVLRHLEADLDVLRARLDQNE